MKNKKILVGLIAITLIAGVSTINAENIIDITINQQHEKTGLELGTNSYARGESSIATGKNSVAIGSGAVATGDNLTGEKIKGMLAENKSKLEEIDAKKNKIKNLSDDINNLKIREHDVIEAGIRVREIQKSKANAKNVWDNAEITWKNKVDGTADAIAEHNRKLADLNSRLTGVSQLNHSDISTPEGLTAAAKELKGKAEQGTSINLSVDFYKDYVTSYYKALGDLRLNNKVISDRGNRRIIDQIRENPLQRDLDGIVLQYYRFSEYKDSSSAGNLSSSSGYHPIYGKPIYGFGTSSNSYSSSQLKNDDYQESSASSASAYNSLGEYSLDINGIGRVTGIRDGGKQIYNGDTYKTYWNVKSDVVDQATFDKWNAVKEGWRAQIHDANRRSGDEVFGKFDTLTNGKSTEIFNMVTDMKFELVDLDYQICYYQGQYEATHDKRWLDKKKTALDLREQKLNTNEQTIKDKYRELFGENLADTKYLFNTIGQNIANQWKQENIVAVEEKNKITTDKLTGELERELGINKNAIQNYENEIKSLREKADQAKKNYEGLNPSEEDLILSSEYERVAKELEEKANKLKKESEELENLQKNLTLNDLKNKGSDAIAYGTNALATGKASIAFGKDTIVTGEKSVAIGADNKITGANTFVLGTNIVSNAENAVILGKDSVGENNTVSVGSTGNERRIIHVGNPTQNTDAVNLQYMKEYVSNIDVTNQISSKADKSDLDKKADKDAGNLTKDDVTKWQSKLGNGEVAEGNTGLVNGDKVNKAITNIKNETTTNITNFRTEITGNLAKKANVDLDNITKNGETVIKNLAIGSIKIEAGVNTTVTTEDKNGSKIYKVNVSKDTIKNVVKSDLDNKADKVDLAKKADKDAGNLTKDDVTKWQSKLGNGEVAEGNTGLVNGDKVNKAITNIKNETTTNITNFRTEITGNLAKKANVDLDNITKNGETVIKNLAIGSIKIEAGVNTTVTTEDKNGSKIYKVNVSKDTIKNVVKSDLDNKADKVDLAKKADKSEILVKTDGKVISIDKTGTANIIDISHVVSKENQGRVIIGVVTDPEIASSVANVSYVNTIAANIMQNMSTGFTNLNNQINETGAASAALSALKYDNEDSKLQLAAGVGHYNSKTAYALGLKYNMNNNVSFHFGSTIGNGKTMLNGGFSIAIGSGHKKVNADVIKRMENMQNEINELKRQNQELMKAIEKMGHVLNIDKVKKDSFKDIPDGHWAKDAVEILHGNGIVEGYPDGEFKGDKPMTRYEYSQMLEKALAKA